MTTYGQLSAYLPQKEAADALRQLQHDADVRAPPKKLQDYGTAILCVLPPPKWLQSRRRQLEKLRSPRHRATRRNQLKFPP